MCTENYGNRALVGLSSLQGCPLSAASQLSSTHARLDLINAPLLHIVREIFTLKTFKTYLICHQLNADYCKCAVALPHPLWEAICRKLRALLRFCYSSSNEILRIGQKWSVGVLPTSYYLLLVADKQRCIPNKGIRNKITAIILIWKITNCNDIKWRCTHPSYPSLLISIQSMREKNIDEGGIYRVVTRWTCRSLRQITCYYGHRGHSKWNAGNKSTSINKNKAKKAKQPDNFVLRTISEADAHNLDDSNAIFGKRMFVGVITQAGGGGGFRSIIDHTRTGCVRRSSLLAQCRLTTQ